MLLFSLSLLNLSVIYFVLLCSISVTLFFVVLVQFNGRLVAFSGFPNLSQLGSLSVCEDSSEPRVVGHLLSRVCRSHYPAVIYMNGLALFISFC